MGPRHMSGGMPGAWRNQKVHLASDRLVQVSPSVDSAK